MIEISLMLLAILMVIVSVAGFKYYKYLKAAQVEYDKSKDVVEDIILSFNTELKRETDRIDNVAYKIQDISLKNDFSIRKSENVEKRVMSLENEKNTQINFIDSLSEANIKSLEKISDLESNLKSILDSQTELNKRINGLEEKIEKISVMPEIKEEQKEPRLPVLPIRKEKAMSSLTDTEIEVIEYLTAEGPKTAPQIKEKVNLSREHTSRLMKKLYEEGYLERETARLPFTYRVKKEMQNLLNKSENV